MSPSSNASGICNGLPQLLREAGGLSPLQVEAGEQSAEFTRSAFRWDGKQLNLTLAKVGHLRIRWSRQFASAPSTVTITKDCAGRYFASLCLDETVEALPKTGMRVGIDLGINRLATLSNGERIANPRHLGERLDSWPGCSASLPGAAKGAAAGIASAIRWPACTPGSPTAAGTSSPS